MNPERWKEVETVLQGALDLPPLERDSFLDAACAGDEELKDEATSLIAAYDEAGDFIEQPAIAHDANVLLGDDLESHIGREFGPYRIIERLGAGGMGEVYLAQDTRLSRLVALKLLPAYFASDDARLRRFQSEARAASALNHPNILTIHEVGEEDGVHFIATEFIDGLTIRELIRTQELSVDDVLDVVEQVASALSAAHSAGIVHRDIKPENIMRRADGLVKILDFGIAKLMESETSDFSSHTEAGLVMGTANYMSPEQARALPVDERTDIWSLGVVLYEMLTGRLPFGGATRMDTLVAILEREPAPLSQVANERVGAPLLQSIVDRCLRKEMTERYPTVSELLVDLKSVRQQFAIGSGPPLAFEQSGRGQAQRAPAYFVRRFAWPILAIVVLISGTFVYRRWLETRQQGASVSTEAPATPAKSYAQMSEAEQLDFVSTQAQRISTMMGDRPAKINEDAARIIKRHVDHFIASTGRRERLSATYERAPPYVPLIARSFAERKVPVIIGIYLPVIESAYQNCFADGDRGIGLFQLMPETAAGYGVSRQDMCDVEKMTPVAAQYIADRMAELGEDAESVTLVLLSYNRGAEWVRDKLRQVRGTENYERNFWTLLANRELLGESFRNESAGYVPQFFAAAIIGENPAAFGLATPPLSTLSGESMSFNR